MKKTCVLLTAVFFLIIGSHSAEALLVLNPANGNYYEVVTWGAAPLTWEESETAAQALSYLGVSGHLATLTSANENSWVFNNLVAPISPNPEKYWLGATDKVTEGTWVWVTAEPWSYSNWNAGEPNNSGDEDYLAFWGKLNDNPDKWNDMSNDNKSRLQGYIVEYDTAIPEPASMLLLGSGLLGLVGLKRRKK